MHKRMYSERELDKGFCALRANMPKRVFVTRSFDLDDGSDVIPGPCGQRRRDALTGKGDSEVDASESVVASQR